MSKASHKLLPCLDSWTVADSPDRLPLLLHTQYLWETQVGQLLYRPPKFHIVHGGEGMLDTEKSQKCLIAYDVQSHMTALRQPSKFHILLERKDERINDKQGIMKSMKYFFMRLVDHLALNSSTEIGNSNGLYNIKICLFLMQQHLDTSGQDWHCGHSILVSSVSCCLHSSLVGV